MFEKNDPVFVTTEGSTFHGESCVVVNVISAGNRTDSGKDLFDHVQVKYACDTLKWFDETALKRDRRSGEMNFDNFPVRRKTTFIDRVMGRSV